MHADIRCKGWEGKEETQRERPRDQEGIDWRESGRERERDHGDNSDRHPLKSTPGRVKRNECGALQLPKL